ncbi:MAG: hypothetical protein C0402_01680 [Thermodesulfovibrio sp.]|nr:hypothetical protein [Thermodesulfovibrio sp.]
MKNIIISSIIGSVFFLLFFSAVSSTQELPAEKTAPALKPATVEEQWGIQVKRISLTANGHMLDLRYKVIDPVKAKPFLAAGVTPQLIDARSGAKMGVPTTPKMGSLRQKTRAPEAGREYFMLFGNKGGLIRVGSKVSLVVGDAKIDNIIVE